MLKAVRIFAIVAVCSAATIIALRVAFPLPALVSETGARAQAEPAETGLGATLIPLAAEHPGKSGIMLLDSGVDAFATRMVLARSATASIDAQYYIWQDDLTGIRLLSELQAAALRGVQVRLLVDDNGTPALDQELAALAALPNAEVRIFNPFTLRGHRLLNYAFDFFRLNRRMHNKSFTVDGIVTVVGGRNIGDDYFETGTGLSFLDLDVLAVGPVARDVEADFFSYWSSGSAYPAQSLIQLQPGSETRLDDRALALRDTPQGRAYSEVVRASSLVEQIRETTLPLEWVSTRLFSDDPAKVLGLDDGSEVMFRRLMAEIGTPESAFDIVSAYFIPGTSAAEKMVEFVESGVRVRVFTNSLEATDVVPVHAGYADYREALISGGVDIFELRAEDVVRRTISDLGIIELSSAALHAKSFSIDRRRAFIGSFNFDPRSKRLNTEMGLLIDSSSLASNMSDWLDANLASIAYHVTKDSAGHMVWTTTDADETPTVFETEPNSTLPLRIMLWFIQLLPVQWLL
ncbi:phospholipase D family protein [Phaeovulum sp.]|uniref:phospholipase D family protein n=1 Tax=Phaeovulum sp. TaxID=2934796 RepID=UPI003569A4EF